jgi:hypothetical protein
MDNRPLLILAAGSVNPNLYGDLGKILTSHIPISGKLAILDQVEKASQVYSTIYILIDWRAKNLGQVLKSKFNVVPILGSAEDSLTDAFQSAFESLELDGGLDILFGDSYSTDLLENKSEIDDVIFIAERNDYSSWLCVARDLVNSSLTFLQNTTKSIGVEIVTGSFRISNLKLFKKILNDQSKVSSKDISFWNSWIKYDEALDTNITLLIDKSWQDIGHVDTYFAARRELIAESSRSFNRITMDKGSLRITKTGPETKIRLEKNWFDHVPPEIRVYTPLTFESKIPNSYEIEYETSIPVNEMWISGNSDDSYWYLFGENLQRLLEVMHSMNEATTPSHEQFAYKKLMYSTKVGHRVESFLKETGFDYFFRKEIRLNGQSLPKLGKVLEEIEKVSMKISQIGNWSIIHGDLCFSNMIYDRRKNQIKLLDPRGSFIEEGIYGDPVYDLIKLSHSVLGNYDFFACNLFSLAQYENHFEMATALPHGASTAKDICEEVINNQLPLRGLTYHDLRMLEAGLFLSAAELHLENDRGLALFLNGLEIAKGVLSE